MHTYQYQPGDKPLEGYTIKSAAGHGGFGEVYYAVSDSGREVALKAVQGFEQIELRGIRQCMNLKSPHLVTIFDVKHNDKGQPFVLMEYVAGPSLRDLIDESPGGLGAQKAAFFLREIAKGLSYLHDCGIVHRDLKPANIFYENGYVKIGDYGLSKAISADHHQSQTVTVGTVHYMAPEVGAGKYDRSIDIYALGVLLYEMLTGHVPFKGDTPSEVLYKHLSSTPELDEIEEPFRAAISKAMVKDPAERYQSVNDLVETVFGEERMKQSMASFSAADLSMVAGQVAAKVRHNAGQDAGGGAAVATADSKPGSTGKVPFEHLADTIQHRMEHVSRTIDNKLFTRGKYQGAAHGGFGDPARDPMGAFQRKLLALIALCLVTWGAGYLSGIDSGKAGFFAMMAGLGAMSGLVFSQWKLMPGLKNESGMIKRLALGGLGILGAGFMGWILAMGNYSQYRDVFSYTLIAIAVPLFLIDWSKQMSCGRADRLSLGSALGAGLLGWIASWFMHDASGMLAFGIPAAIALAVQAISPFDPTTIEDWALDDDDDIPPPRDTQARKAPPAPGAGGKASYLPPHARRKQAAHRTEQVNAYSAVVTKNCSDKSRLAALLLACMSYLIPICGLHRFYVGKVGTGILWLLTFGLFGIGQLIDVILIACGSFNDVNGRPITEWQPDGSRTVVSTPKPHGHVVSSKTQPHLHHPERRHSQGFVGVLLSLVATIMIFLGMILVLGLSLELPEAIAANTFGSDIGPWLNNALGYDDVSNAAGWPELMQRVSFPLAIMMLIFGGVLLAVARRREGVMHMFRALFGAGGMLIAVAISTEILNHSQSLDQLWRPVADHIQGGRVGPAIETFMQHTNSEPFVFSVIFLVGSILILAWPAKRRDAAGPRPIGEGA